MAALEVCSLVVRYGERTAVDEASFAADAGQVLTLLGPNGAGKTTTVETLEGYRRPSAGTVRVLGLDPRADRTRLMPSVGVMLQNGGVYPALSPRRALRLFASYYKDPQDPAELIERVGLAGVATTPWRQLSGGEQQRLSLALALVGRPRVAFLDEPTAGVDPVGRRAIREVIASLAHDGCCVLLTTHDLEEAQRLSDRVVILAEGRVLAEGSPEELMRANAGDQIRFAGPPGLPVEALSGHLGAPVDEAGPGEYVIQTPPTPEAVARLTAWLAEHQIPLGDLRAGRRSLEDVFVQLTSSTSQAAEQRGRVGRRGRR